MDAQTLVSTLQARGFTLTATDGGIAIKPSKLLTDSDRAEIRTLKAEMLAFLQSAAEHLNTQGRRPALSLATREVMRRLDTNVETPCCGVRFAFLSTERVCPSCKLRWPNEDLKALQMYLERKREGVKTT